MDDPIGYEVLIMELRGTFELYCEIYGMSASKKAIRQVYTEVFKNEQVPREKTVLDGIVFDSRHEANRYAELKLLQRAGKIKNLRCQVPFELIPSQDGERAVKYIADFVYEENGKEVVEDAKGFHPKEYIIKRKLMLWVHGIKVSEV